MLTDEFIRRDMRGRDYSRRNRFEEEPHPKTHRDVPQDQQAEVLCRNEQILERISLAKLDGTLLKVFSHIERNVLVILDDFGLWPVHLKALQVVHLFRCTHGNNC